MKYVGIDLHKQTISVCAVTKDKQVLVRKRFYTRETERIHDFFAGLGEFQMVVEATASYEWLFRLLEPLASRAVLAHPGKLRIIAESTRKSDRHDAQALAERLAEDAVPQSYRPTPRQRDHRRLVRQRIVIQRKITAVKNRLRRLLTDYNADVRNLFSTAGREHFAQVALSEADRFIGQQYWHQLEFYGSQLRQVDHRLAEFARSGSPREQEARALLRTIPAWGRSPRRWCSPNWPTSRGSARRRRWWPTPTGPWTAGVGRQAAGAHREARLAALAVGRLPGGLATGAALAALAERVPEAQGANEGPEGDHGPSPGGCCA